MKGRNKRRAMELSVFKKIIPEKKKTRREEDREGGHSAMSEEGTHQ